MSDQPDSSAAGYGGDEEGQAQIDRRHRKGTIWRLVFQAATVIGILALVALIYNIFNSAFGLVAIQAEQNSPVAGTRTGGIQDPRQRPNGRQ